MSPFHCSDLLHYKSIFVLYMTVHVALLGYAGTDHSGQGLNAKVLWNKLWRGSKNSKVATFIRLTWKSSFPLPVIQYTIWVCGKALCELDFSSLAFAGFCQIWCELILLESCKAVIISYFLIIIWWQTLDEGRRRTSLGDKTLRGFCLSAAVHEPWAAVHTLFTVLGKKILRESITPDGEGLCVSAPNQSLYNHIPSYAGHCPAFSNLSWGICTCHLLPHCHDVNIFHTEDININGTWCVWVH